MVRSALLSSLCQPSGSRILFVVADLLWAPGMARPDDVTVFGERHCLRGGLGQIPARELMALVLAHAGRLRRYGA